MHGIHPSTLLTPKQGPAAFGSATPIEIDGLGLFSAPSQSERACIDITGARERWVGRGHELAQAAKREGRFDMYIARVETSGWASCLIQSRCNDVGVVSEPALRDVHVADLDAVDMRDGNGVVEPNPSYISNGSIRSSFAPPTPHTAHLPEAKPLAGGSEDGAAAAAAP